MGIDGEASNSYIVVKQNSWHCLSVSRQTRPRFSLDIVLEEQKQQMFLRGVVLKSVVNSIEFKRTITNFNLLLFRFY